MATAVHIRPTPSDGGRPGDIVSRCGLLCNTCSAYITGACPGCPNLEQGECVIRDCADLKGTNCLDCQATSCYHFEAYTWRRKSMNAKAKHFVRITMPNGQLQLRGGCNSGGCGSGCGGCSLADGGCPAVRIAESLQAV